MIYCDGGQNALTCGEAWGSVRSIDGTDLIAQYQSLFSDMTLKDVDLPILPQFRLKAPGVLTEKRTIVVSLFTDVKLNRIMVQNYLL